MTVPAVPPADERRHEPGPELLWNESWYFDFVAADGSVGGYVRLGLYPNLGTAWYWACLVGEGRPLVTVIDHDIAIPRTGLEVRSDGLWAGHNLEEPLEHWSLACEAFAVGLDHPSDVYGDLRGDRVAFGFDLEWETDGSAYPYPGVTRYEVPCRVHGEVLVGQERIELAGTGQRDHSWGVRDWWTPSWLWHSSQLEDGTRFHATHVTVDGQPLYYTGYVQPLGGPLAAVTEVARQEELGAHGFPHRGTVVLDGRTVAIEPVAFAPVRLDGPEGQVSHFPRALCRITSGGLGGWGWTEWNQPQAMG